MLNHGPWAQARDSGRAFADHAETVAEWVATERYRHGARCSKLGFDEAPFRTNPFQRGIEILDVNVDVNWSPVSLVAAHITSAR
jgi:hypothetical protein